MWSQKGVFFWIQRVMKMMKIELENVAGHPQKWV